MARISLLAALAFAAFADACTPTLGPPPAGPTGSSAANAVFSAAAFAWSQQPGDNIIAGRAGFQLGRVRYTCAGSTVVLTPETPWLRQRMYVLYGSTEQSALPASEVRDRAATAPPGDAGPYVQRTTCDDADQFAFAGLPDGVWYAITIARPAADPNGASMALMRRVVTRGGRTVSAIF